MPENLNQIREFDVAISFAGEDRHYAKALSEKLAFLGIRVFYDEKYKSLLFGEDLYIYLTEIYFKKVKDYCLIIISKNYVKNDWTNVELKAALARELKNPGYILPIRLDDTEIPGILPTKAYINWPPETPESIANIIRDKLGTWPKIALFAQIAIVQAIQKVGLLANQEPKTAELLNAGTLRTLYLNRFNYMPSDWEKQIIFQNLLLKGRGKYRGNRALKLETETSLASPASLGWYWFNALEQKEALKLIRQCTRHPHVYVRAGSARALGHFGDESDRDLLKNMLTDNSNVAAMAIRSLSNIGAKGDINLIFNFQDDRRSEVREALAYAIWRYGIIEGESICYKLLSDPNMAVRRAAIIALGILTIKNVIMKDKALSTLETIISNSDGQALATAGRVKRRLLSDAVFEAECVERYIQKAARYHRFDDMYTESSSNKARRLLLSKPSPSQDAAIQWLVKYEAENVENIMIEFGPELTFYVVREFDYYIYCPKWWRLAMDKPLDCELYEIDN